MTFLGRLLSKNGGGHWAVYKEEIFGNICNWKSCYKFSLKSYRGQKHSEERNGMSKKGTADFLARQTLGALSMQTVAQTNIWTSMVLCPSIIYCGHQCVS